MSMPPISPREREIIDRAVVRMRTGILALSCALIGGVGLLVATLFLVIKGGPNMGQHLSLLSQYFPGYRVTWIGSLVGLFYGALVGGIAGWSTAWLYNRVVRRRSRK